MVEQTKQTNKQQQKQTNTNANERTNERTKHTKHSYSSIINSNGGDRTTRMYGQLSCV